MPPIGHPSAATAPTPSGVGVLLTAGIGPGHDLAALGDACTEMEEAGVSAIWFADHLFWGSPSPDPLVAAALATAATRRCTIGTGVLQLPLRHPASVAKAATTLALASRHRFVLGVGVGEHEAEFALASQGFHDRGERMDQALADLRRWWEGSDEGWYRQLPAPGPVPVWIGGRSPRALRRAAEVGDGWFPLFLPPAAFADACDRLEAELKVRGRPNSAVRRAAVALVAVTGRRHTRGDALDWLGRTYRLPSEVFDRHLVTGTLDTVRDHVGAYRAAGADHIALIVAQDDPVAATRDLGLLDW